MNTKLKKYVRYDIKCDKNYREDIQTNSLRELGSQTIRHIGPSVGALNAESHKRTYRRFFLRIYTIFCVRGATYISNVSRMRAAL